MVLGEDLFTGGKALKSDILAKRIEFFKNLSDHVKLIGDRTVKAGSVQLNDFADFYTVPQKKLYFLFMIHMDDRNIAAGNRRVNFRIKGESAIMSITSRADTQANKDVVFNSPIILKEGEVLRIDKNDSLTGHEANVSVTGYEVDKETAVR